MTKDDEVIPEKFGRNWFSFKDGYVSDGSSDNVGNKEEEKRQFKINFDQKEGQKLNSIKGKHMDTLKKLIELDKLDKIKQTEK